MYYVIFKLYDPTSQHSGVIVLTDTQAARQTDSLVAMINLKYKKGVLWF